mgnify:CR=1 FL=1
MNESDDPPAAKPELNFGGKLPHAIPDWVDRQEAIFHIRIRAISSLTAKAETARALLDSVVFYAEKSIWLPCVFLLMPDHLHALVHFHPERSMSRIVGDWKKWHTINTLHWQDGYFDHRLRNDESFDEQAAYIWNNPVAAGLCATPEGWPWWLSTSLTDGKLIKGYDSSYI